MRYIGLLGFSWGMFLGILFVLNYVVDPFGFRPSAMLSLHQAALGESSHDRMFRLARFRNAARQIVVLGDSRAQNMREEYFRDLGVDVANLAYGGGTLYEAIETFWFVDSIQEPKHVIIGIPFNLWSESNSFNRVTEATGILSRPAHYYLNAYVAGVSLRILWRNVTGATAVSHAPPVSKDEFWVRQLQGGIGQFYGRWSRPRVLRQEFLRMVEHCRKNGIRLTIVIPPTHVDLQRKISEYGLEGAFREYLDDMSHVGTLLNFDTVNERNADRENFGDPFHAKAALMREVTEIVVREAIGRSATSRTPSVSSAGR